MEVESEKRISCLHAAFTYNPLLAAPEDQARYCGGMPQVNACLDAFFLPHVLYHPPMYSFSCTLGALPCVGSAPLHLSISTKTSLRGYGFGTIYAHGAVLERITP
jgi:hypothetical protein